MPRHPLRPAALGGVVVLALGALTLLAGPLDPPSGPITPTYKTLTEVEPRIAINATNTPGDADSVFRITQPGSYYLTADVPVQILKHGIKIAISRVKIDLNGFVASGSNLNAFDGITAAGTLTSIEIVNGTVAGCADGGIDLGASTNCRVRGVHATNNGGRGILIGPGGMVTDCLAASNGSVGISVGSGSTVAGCVARLNTLSGIGTGQDCTIVNCTAVSNSSTGINASNGCTLDGCTANLNDTYGIAASSGSTVTNCTTFGNTAGGISVTTVSTVAGCTARTNGIDGIVVASRCVVRGNTCGDNGSDPGTGAGIHATGNDNRIEDNNCAGGTTQDRGIDVDGAGNLIVRNSCAGNVVDWDIVANNVVGPILDRRVPGSAAINGFSAPDSTGSTHSNANFSY